MGNKYTKSKNKNTAVMFCKTSRDAEYKKCNYNGEFNINSVIICNNNNKLHYSGSISLFNGDDIYYRNIIKINNKLYTMNNYGCLYFDNDNDKYHSREKGRLKYSGEFLDGKYHGYGVEFHEDGNIKYSGKFKNGHYDGIECTYYYPKAAHIYKYIGTFINGKKDGYGILYYKNCKKYYDGNFEHDEPNGYGIQYHENGKLYFKGTFYGGYFCYGMEYHRNGNIRYKGHYVMSEKKKTISRENTYLFNNKLESKDIDINSFHGKGTYYTKKNKIIKGIWYYGIIKKRIILIYI